MAEPNTPTSRRRLDIVGGSKPSAETDTADPAAEADAVDDPDAYVDASVDVFAAPVLGPLKLRAPENSADLVLAGETYALDEDGNVEIPRAFAAHAACLGFKEV